MIKAFITLVIAACVCFYITHLSQTKAQPVKQGWELVSYDKFSLDVVKEVLTVEGYVSSTGWEVKLDPEQHKDQPEFWIIRVYGKKPTGPAATVITAYKQELKLKDYTFEDKKLVPYLWGTKGVQIMGQHAKKGELVARIEVGKKE